MTTIIKDNLFYINKLKKIKVNFAILIIIIILILDHINYYWTNILS